MFDVSFTELMIIGVVALVVIGPERLPKVARTVGHLLGRAQRYVNDVKSDIRREIELDELRKFKEEMDAAASEVQTSLRDTEQTVRSAGQSLRADLDATAGEARAAVTGSPGQAPGAVAAPDGAASDAAAPANPPEAPASPAATQAPPPAPTTGKTT
ncbi:Sec-independent protein translocase protein TatB [Bordetella sp. 2513F-2]